MAFVVVAKWTTREGEADKVEEAIRKLTPLSREEPGNLFYQAHRDPENPNLFFLYEQYVDEDGFKGPPSTDLGVQMNVRTKNGTGYWQSTQLDLMSLHTGTHVESALHTVEGGEAIDEVALDRVIGEAVVLDLTPTEPMQIIDVADL